MSDNIPFDIQIEIIKKVYDVKSLIRFRSVSKPWKSFIDSADFIKGYGARHTQPHSFILSYRVYKKFKYMCFVDDDNNETFKVKQQELAPSVVSPLLKQQRVSYVVGACHGLLCLFCYDEFYSPLVVIWNPSIRKSFGLAVDSHDGSVFGFGVCPVTRDPTIVQILETPWHAKVFTLSSGVWNVIPSGNLPRQTIRLDPETQVVIDRFIYWAACEKTYLSDDGVPHYKYMVVSFDLIAKEFRVVDLPDSLTKDLCSCCSLSKLRESLVVYESIYFVGEGRRCGVWVMEHDSSFRKLFTIGAPVNKIMGFKKNGETIFESRKELGPSATLNVYDPCSQQIKNLGISGVADSFFMGPCKESLLLLNHLDLIVYCDDN